MKFHEDEKTREAKNAMMTDMVANSFGEDTVRTSRQIPIIGYSFLLSWPLSNRELLNNNYFTAFPKVEGNYGQENMDRENKARKIWPGKIWPGKIWPGKIWPGKIWPRCYP